MKKTVLTSALLSSLLVIGGCSDDSDKEAVKKPADKPMTQSEIDAEKARRVFNPTAEERAQDQAEEAARQAKLDSKAPITVTLPAPGSQPDFADYKTVESGVDWTFIYNANQKTPDDALTLANSFGILAYKYDFGDAQLNELLTKFSETSDEFEKRDIAKQLEPVFARKIEENKGVRYVRLEVPDQTYKNLSGYDFDKKGFAYNADVFNAPNTMSERDKVSAMSRGRIVKEKGWISYSDNDNYSVSFSNGPRFQFLEATDETVARQLESYVKNNKPYTAVVYGYVDELTRGRDENTDPQRYSSIHIQKLDIVDAADPAKVILSVNE
ncbi:hypothetical protein [Pseudomonas sp.]|uniref:hypothetical protein n=1 Tax=Pseudomonas sp. TaxID=306 RepID=UPI0028B26353|nr:hypothetical protein [Pseudomonas sp.]